MTIKQIFYSIKSTEDQWCFGSWNILNQIDFCFIKQCRTKTPLQKCERGNISCKWQTHKYWVMVLPQKTFLHAIITRCPLVNQVWCSCISSKRAIWGPLKLIYCQFSRNRLILTFLKAFYDTNKWQCSSLRNIWSFRCHSKKSR